MALDKKFFPKKLFPVHWLALLLVFVLSFILNFLWEEFHSVLYISYQGGPITQATLFHATLADASFITLISIFFFNSRALREQLWIIVPIGLTLAIGIEMWAQSTDRWVYASAMPLVPLINVGLTPTVQLALTGYITLWMVRKTQSKIKNR